MSTPPVMSIVPPYTPELLPAVQVWVQNMLHDCPRKRVLEFGAGWSTIWFALLGCEMLSLEHDFDWGLEVARVLRQIRPHRVGTWVAIPECFPWYASQAPDEWYDLVLVDCIDEERIPCVEASRNKVRKGGWIIVDDTHWDMLKPAFDILAGWPCQQFDGEHVRKTGETHYHHTTIFERPA